MDEGDFRFGIGLDNSQAASQRASLATQLGFDPTHLVVPNQPHQANVAVVPGQDDQDLTKADAAITNSSGWLVGVTVADCAAILIYDPRHQAVAAVHSGWRSTKAQIVLSTLTRLAAEYSSRGEDILAYVSPLAQKCCYEVQSDFLAIFKGKYFDHRDGKVYFDNQAVIRDQLTQAGVAVANIEFDNRCTMHDLNLRSFRRDGQSAGRMLGTIGLKP